MKLRVYGSLLLSFFSIYALCQADPVIHTVYLIGDVGADTLPTEAVQLLYFECFDDTASTIVFLGDNVYPAGNKPSGSARQRYFSERVLISQLEALALYRGNCYMIPGNHDWSNGKSSGLKAIRNQQHLVDGWSKINTSFLNKGNVYLANAGQPGPQSVMLAPKLRLLMLDSQWWLQADLLHPIGKRPGMNRKQTRRKAFSDLDSLLTLSERSGELVLLAAHHPLFSNGRHSHRREPLRSLFNYTPLHILSVLGLNRFFREDIPQPRYQRYKKSILKITSKHSNVIYAAGHEHNMQYMVENRLHHIVSGSGSKLSPIDRYRYPSKFMDDLQTGFFSITLHQSGAVYLHAYGTRDRGEYWRTLILNMPINSTIR